MDSTIDLKQFSSLSTAEPDPGFSKRSCTGRVMLSTQEKPEEQGVLTSEYCCDSDLGPSQTAGWTIDLKHLPRFTKENLNNQLNNRQRRNYSQTRQLKIHVVTK